MSQNRFLNAVHTLALLHGAEQLLAAAANSTEPSVTAVAQRVSESLKAEGFPVTHSDGHWYIGLPEEYQEDVSIPTHAPMEQSRIVTHALLGHLLVEENWEGEYA